MADPELSYGVEPLLHDKDFQVQDFLDLYLPIDQLISEIDESLHRKTSRTNERDDSFVGLPVPNYPAPPRLKVNQLYWPTGASRWARGYFLCTENTKKSLTTISNKRDWTLKAVTELGTLETTLHLLPPRPVSNVDGSTTNLWLLPVVDDRYYWQFMDFGNTTINTWSSLIDDIAIRLGISITKDTPATDYISPDATLFNRKYDNAAVVLDAVAHSIGHRITRDLDGTVKSRNWDTHAETDADNIDPTSGDWAQIAGGQYWCEPVPQTLKVCFPKSTCRTPRCDRDYYVSTKNALDYTSAIRIVDTEKTIFSSQWAIYNDSQSYFENQTVLDDLADQIAADYYAPFSSLHHDITYLGIKPWLFSGFDDHALYTFGCEYETLPALKGSVDEGQKLERTFCRAYTTRIQSPPMNFGVDQQTTNYVLVYPPQGLIPVKLTASLAASGTATANQLTWSGGSWAEDTNCNLTVNEPFGSDNYDSGQKLWVRRSCENGRYETLGTSGSLVTSTGVEIIAVVPSIFFTPGSGVLCNEYEWNGSNWVDSGADQFVWDDAKACCLLAGQLNWAHKVDTARWLMFPHGLLRQAVVDESAGIDVGASGTVNMLDFSGATCAGVEKTTGHAVEVCNGSANTNGARKVFNDERVTIQYFPSDIWHIVDVPRVLLLGQPDTQSDGDNGATSTYKIMKWSGGAFSQWGTNTLLVRNQSGIDHVNTAIYAIRYFGNSDEPLAFPEQIEMCP